MYAPKSKWTICFLGISVAQNLIVLSFEICIFYFTQVKVTDIQDYLLSDLISTFLSLYIFAILYQLFLVYDALQQQNTIQILGLVIMNVGLLIYGALQVDAVSNFYKALSQTLPQAIGPSLSATPFLIAIPCILSLSTIAMLFVAWKLWDEFAWTILRLVSADLKMRQRYLNYQIYLVLLKFGVFYYLGSLIQFIVVVRGRSNTEFAITCACIPITFFGLLMAFYAMKHESMIGMIAVVGLFIAELAGLMFKMVRLYEPGYSTPYVPARKSLTGFTILTIAVLLITMVYAYLCMSAFGKGLKPFVNKSTIKDYHESHDQDVSVTSDGRVDTRGQSIEMVSNLRARLGGYRPARST